MHGIVIYYVGSYLGFLRALSIYLLRQVRSMKSFDRDDKRLSCDEDGSGYTCGWKAIRRRDVEPLKVLTTGSADKLDAGSLESLRAGIMGNGCKVRLMAASSA